MRPALPAMLVLLATFAPVARAADLLDLNAATVDELDTLPGIGPAKARAIIAEREMNGPFTDIDALGRVKGIGASTLARLRPLTKVGDGRRPAKSTPPPDRPQPLENTKESNAAPAPGAAPEALDSEPPDGKLNLNLASADELQTLDGIASANAKIIVAYRRVKGPFRMVSELARVPGLPPRLFQTVKYFVTVRLEANAATSDQLLSLGFAPSAASAIVGYRGKIGGYKSPGDVDRIPGLGADERTSTRQLLWFGP